MGQSFLTHDEKSSGSPSPDLLQFNGTTNPKFFGSLSSVKESSTLSSSSRSPLLLETVAVESHSTTSASSTSTTSARSPRPVSPTDTAASGSSSDLYSSLVPTPICPGNVSRLREKFMDFDRQQQRKRVPPIGLVESEDTAIYTSSSRRDGENTNITTTTTRCGKEAISESDCHRFIPSRAATTSPGSIAGRSGNSRGGTFPPSRSRSSLYSLNPVSTTSSGGGGGRGSMRSKIRTLPPPSPPSSSTTHDDKLNVIRSDNDLSECFKKMTVAGSCSYSNMGSFVNETPLVRHRPPRTRPNVPPPRSVIIRAGYLPVVQTVSMIPTLRSSNNNNNNGRASASTGSRVASPSPRQRQEQDEAVVGANKCNTECVTTTSRAGTSTSYMEHQRRKEDLRLISSSVPNSSSVLEAECKAHVVTKHEDHSEKKVLRKDAEVNTSAEVLILPKGTKTSVLLKAGLIDEVDGGKILKQRRKKKKKGGIRRVARVFGRIVIRLVELF